MTRHLTYFAVLAAVAICFSNFLAQAQTTKPRILIIRGRLTPENRAGLVTKAIERDVEFASESDFRRDSRASGLAWYSEAALTKLLRQQNVKMAIIIETQGRRDQSVLLTFRNGRNGKPVMTSEYDVRSQRRGGGLERRIRNDVLIALASMDEGSAQSYPKTKASPAPKVQPQPTPPPALVSKPQPVPVVKPSTATVEELGDDSLLNDSAASEGVIEAETPTEKEPAEPVEEGGAVLAVTASLGGGIGTRLLNVPSDLGFRRLNLDMFPTAGIGVDMVYRSKPTARMSYRLIIDYRSSVGLKVVDRRPNGNELETGGRAQRWEVAAGFLYKTKPTSAAISLGGLLGWSVESFDAEQPISVPDFVLSGPQLAAVFIIPLEFISSRTFFTVSPDASLVFVGDALETLGAKSMAPAVGGYVDFSLGLSETLALSLRYRRSQVFLSTDSGSGASANDVAQWLQLRLTYTP
jgi:hypothetical protein